MKRILARVWPARRVETDSESASPDMSDTAPPLSAAWFEENIPSQQEKRKPAYRAKRAAMDSLYRPSGDPSKPTMEDEAERLFDRDIPDELVGGRPVSDGEDDSPPAGAIAAGASFTAPRKPFNRAAPARKTVDTRRQSDVSRKIHVDRLPTMPLVASLSEAPGTGEFELGTLPIRQNGGFLSLPSAVSRSSRATVQASPSAPSATAEIEDISELADEDAVSGPDIDELARSVYRVIKGKLQLEGERLPR